MGVVASAAVFVRHGAVVLWIVGEELFEIGQFTAVVVCNTVYTMAGNTKVKRQADKKVFNVCTVRVVAVDARLAFDRDIVFHFGFGGHRIQVRMATETQWAYVIHKQHWVFGIVGVMAIDAGCHGGRMGEFARQELLEILMTIQANFVGVLKERTGLSRCLFLVAQTAVAIGKR